MDDGVYAMAGDLPWDIEYFIINEVCGLSHDEYIRNNKILTKQIFQKNFNKIVEGIDEFFFDNIYTAYLVLGRFVLLLGADITEEIRAFIIHACNRPLEKYRWAPDEIEDRKCVIEELKTKIENYKNGIPDPISEDLGLQENK